MIQNLFLSPLTHYNYYTSKVESQHLKGNPLGDSFIRYNPVIVPKEEGNFPLVLVLSGFTGNGPKYLNVRTFEKNMAEVIDELTSQKVAPKAIYVFVEAMTFWGGSQFLNSTGMGKYEDYIIKELVPQLQKEFSVTPPGKDWAVMGGSSGGLGAIHLGSKYPELFSYIGAIAPDSDFEKSLLPEIFTAIPLIEKMGGIAAVADEIKEEKFFRRKSSHTILNAIAMGLCYSGDTEKNLKWPVDIHTGDIIPDLWAKWLKFDPVHFVKKRADQLKQLKGIYLDVGKYDQYHLQYGARKIRANLVEIGVPCEYGEFSGNHFDISTRRPQFLSWLEKKITQI